MINTGHIIIRGRRCYFTPDQFKFKAIDVIKRFVQGKPKYFTTWVKNIVKHSTIFFSGQLRLNWNYYFENLSRLLSTSEEKLTLGSLSSIYSRWLPIHTRNLLNLKWTREVLCAKILARNLEDLFRLQSQTGDGEVVGLAESPAALGRWMAAGPKIARARREFESTYDVWKTAKTCHHGDIHLLRKLYLRTL